MNKAALILISALSATWANAGGVAPYTDCRVVVTNGILRLEPLPRNRVFAVFLVRFSAEPGLHSTPDSFILSGKVVDNNAGSPAQGTAISIRAPGDVPRLAAITDVDGGFRFRVYIEARPRAFDANAIFLIQTVGRDVTLRLPSISDGDLCLGGVFDTNRVLVSGTVSRYRLGELIPSVKKEVAK
jgi:hypothetical protein